MSSKSLLVSGLTESIEEKHLMRALGGFGEIKSIELLEQLFFYSFIILDFLKK